MDDAERVHRLLQRSAERVSFVASQGGLSIHVDLLNLVAGDLRIIQAMIDAPDAPSSSQKPEGPVCDAGVPQGGSSPEFEEWWERFTRILPDSPVHDGSFTSSEKSCARAAWRSARDEYEVADV